MGKVQNAFGYGSAGAIARSVDDIVIAIRNASDSDIEFGAPVFMTENGAVPFNTTTPQDFTTFLGFAVRVADKTPESYPSGQFNTASSSGEAGVWKAGDIMEVLVRGSIALASTVSGSKGSPLYIRKSDGRLTASAGAAGSTILLENVRVRNPRNGYSACCEAIVNKRNIL
jgi:hypothetical protein